MKAVALLGGPKENWPQDLKKQIILAKKAGDLIIGVDRGSLLLLELGIEPDLALGDFDSLKAEELAAIEKVTNDVRYSNPIKDFTDSELMIRTAFEDYRVSQLTVYGATGGRLDHGLINLFMILSPAVRKFANQIKLIDRQNELEYFLPGQYRIKQEPHYSFFGILCATPVTGLNLTNARYNLTDFATSYPLAYSSNEFLPEKGYFDLSFKTGVMAVIFARDLNRFQEV